MKSLWGKATLASLPNCPPGVIFLLNSTSEKRFHLNDLLTVLKFILWLHEMSSQEFFLQIVVVLLISHLSSANNQVLFEDWVMFCLTGSSVLAIVRKSPPRYNYLTDMKRLINISGQGDQKKVNMWVLERDFSHYIEIEEEMIFFHKLQMIGSSTNVCMVLVHSLQGGKLMFCHRLELSCNCALKKEW